MERIYFLIATLDSRRLLLAFALTANLCSAAQEFSSYGKVTPAELKMTECAFDKEADAVVLIDEAVSSYNDEYNLITSRHVRIKILKETGIHHANISIPFYRKDGFEFISNVEGMVINSDPGNNPVNQILERKSIYTTNVSDRIGTVSLPFPSVKAGSIIEYTYRSTMKHYGGLDDWEFQREIPVVLSKYLLYIVPNAEFAYQVRKSDRYPIKVDLQKKDARVSFEMENLPGLGDEPYMDARKDYLQRVIFQLSGFASRGSDKRNVMTTWSELTKELINTQELGSQISKDLPGTDNFINLVKPNPSALEKMKLVLNYVRKNMTWNHVNSKYSIDGVKSAWNKKTGTSGDINLILVNLLKSSGLEAYPMLVSERYNGKVNTDYPYVDQFNTVYAAVIADGKKYFLDATDPLTPPHIIPYNILNTTGFILNKKAGGLIHITDESLQYRDFITVIAKINPDETIRGEVFINSMDYARIRRLEKYASDNKKYIDENFKLKPSISIDSFAIMNEDKDSVALQHKFNFAVPLEGTGEYKFIPLNMFSGFETNPFLSEKRFSDINFSFKRFISFTALMTIPNEYVVDAMPKSIKLTNVDNSVLFSRELIKDAASNQIVCRFKMDFKKSHYGAEEYDSIREFYKKMFDMLTEQIVLKKKATP